MIQSIKKLAVAMFLVAAFTSCNQGPTLQTYYVDNELQPGFTSFDVPTSLVNVENLDLTDEQRKAYESVNKLNILAYKYDQNKPEEYNSEVQKVKTILKNKKYDELMRAGSAVDGRFVVKFLGDVENIDELIVFGNANERGFVIARVLGDDMNAGELMSLESVIKDAKFEDSQLKQLTDFFN